MKVLPLPDNSYQEDWSDIVSLEDDERIFVNAQDNNYSAITIPFKEIPKNHINIEFLQKENLKFPFLGSKNSNFEQTLSFNEYQRRAAETAIYPKGFGLSYTALGLAGEAGEYSGEVSKVIRDDNGKVTEERAKKLKSEISDVFWFVAMVCTELGLTMEEVAQFNLDKLASRKARGTLSGSGNDR